MSNVPGPMSGGFLDGDMPLPPAAPAPNDLLSQLDEFDDEPTAVAQPSVDPLPAGPGVTTMAPPPPTSGLPVGPPMGSGGLPTAPGMAPAPAAPPATPPMAPPVAPPANPLGMTVPTLARPEDPTVDMPSARPEVKGPHLPPAASEAGVIELTPDDLIEEDGEFIALDDILLYMLENGGSDLHLSVASPPMIRVRGDMEAIPGYPPFTPKSLQETMYAALSERQKQKFEETKELDFAYSLPGAARFRVNMFQQKGSFGAVLRTIPWEIKSLEELGMPAILGSFADFPRGLVLVTGPTGSGKSTTLAAIIDKANRTRPAHIMTIEDPIEFVHQHRMSVVNQREVGEDTWSFQAALKHALRQDPDIILVGEMRDLETISIALTAAETGHLVFGTLHTSSAASTIDRIIDVFPPEQQAQIRAQLGGSLQAVVCQALCKTADGKGRAAALEIMIATPAIRNLIREGKLQSIPSALQTGSKFGMQTLNQHLAEMVKANRITYEVAREKCSDASELHQMLGMAAENN